MSLYKNKKGALSLEAAKEEIIRQVQQKQQQMRDQKADRDKMNKLQSMKNDAINSMVERKEKRRHDEMLRQYEIDSQKLKVQNENKLYSKRRRNQLIQK